MRQKNSARRFIGGLGGGGLYSFACEHPNPANAASMLSIRKKIFTPILQNASSEMGGSETEFSPEMKPPSRVRREPVAHPRRARPETTLAARWSG